MDQVIYALDLIGTFSFAVYGTYFALKKDFDLFGVFVSAFLSGLGGGTVREVMLDHLPFYFFDMNYIWAVILAILFTILIYRKFHKIKRFALYLDSVGLVTFAFIGASKGAEMGLGIFAITFLATITAVGGGVLRDMVLNKLPQIMHYGFYASVAVLIGFVYGLLQAWMQTVLGASLLLAGGLFIRLLVIHFKINLWKPKTIFSKKS